MPTLHVRNVPADLYQLLQDEAAVDNRSLSAQVVVMLQGALQGARRRKTQEGILAQLRQQRFKPPQGAPESGALLAEDRRR